MPETKKQRLAKRAAKAHARAQKRGDTPVGTRKGPSSPRTLSNTEIPVYKREQKLLDKIRGSGRPKKKKIKTIPPLFQIERKKSSSRKKTSKLFKKRNCRRQGRRHGSCK